MDYIYTLLWSMTPICELRCAIPIGMDSYDIPLLGRQGYDLAWYVVFPLAVLGNLVPGVFWLLVLPRMGAAVTSFPNPAGRLLEWRSAQLKRRYEGLIQQKGTWALVLLVAVPLPMTGVWTGSLAAWVFEVPFWRALAAIATGALIAGIIVTSLTAVGLRFLGG